MQTPRSSRKLTVVPDDGARPVAVVAGASRGIGLLIARELAARGCRVVGLARDAESLAAARATMRGWGHDYTTYVADVTDAEGLTEVVHRVEREVGPVDVSVAVAGVIQVGPLEAMTREHFRMCIDIMLWGPINLAEAVLPSMRRRGRGRIGTVTSIGGVVSVPHLLPYSTAKFGAVGFSEGLSAELAGTGITATTIVPGLMRTGSHVQAQFTGNAAAEYAWFGPSASLPLLAMDAEKAAARIADGVLAGKPTVVLGPTAQIGMRVHGLAPATTIRLLGVAARLLPARGEAPVGRTVTGERARAMLAESAPRASRVVEGLTTLGTRATHRFNEAVGRSGS